MMTPRKPRVEATLHELLDPGPDGVHARDAYALDMFDHLTPEEREEYVREKLQHARAAASYLGSRATGGRPRTHDRVAAERAWREVRARGGKVKEAAIEAASAGGYRSMSTVYELAKRLGWDE